MIVMVVMVMMTMMIVVMMVTMVRTMMVTVMMMMIMVMASLTGHIYLATLPIEAQLWPASANWYTLYLEATFAFRWILSMSINVQTRGSKHQICLWNQILLQGWLDLCSAPKNYFRDSISSKSIQICCQIKIWPTGPWRRSVNTNHLPPKVLIKQPVLFLQTHFLEVSPNSVTFQHPIFSWFLFIKTLICENGLNQH